MAAHAIRRGLVAHQRIQRRACETRIGKRGEALAAADFLDFRSLQLDLGAAAGVRTRPSADPHGECVAAGRRRGQPAVVATDHLGDHARLIGLRQVGDRVGRLVSEVHVIVASEGRRLSARAMAGAATIVALDLLPQFDAEGLHVGVGRGRAGVVADRRQYGDRILDRGRAAARATGKRDDGGRGRDPAREMFFVLHRVHLVLPQSPMQCTAASAKTCFSL